jgi:hypothetical protein
VAWREWAAVASIQGRHSLFAMDALYIGLTPKKKGLSVFPATAFSCYNRFPQGEQT